MTSTLQVHPIPAFDDNYIWALRQGDAVAVVDPGDAGPVREFLAREQCRLTAILITHHHADHTAGIAELATGLPVYGPALEDIPGVTQGLMDGDLVELPGLGIALEVLAVPGHTRGHLAYYRPGSLFCGDTLFACGCGRLFEGTARQMHDSLARLAALPPATQIFCAHEYTAANLRFARAVEPDNAALARLAEEVAARRARREPTIPTTLAQELATNPFLRWQSPTVIAAARERLGHAPADSVAVFAAIREWKNNF